MEDHQAKLFSRLTDVASRLSEGLIDPSLRSDTIREAEASLSFDGRKTWLMVDGAASQRHARSGVVPVRIDGAIEATLVSQGGLRNDSILQNDEEPCFGPDLELFPIAKDPYTGLPTSEYLDVSAEAHHQWFAAETVKSFLVHARRHWGFYEVMVNREELMCIRPGYGLPELLDDKLEQAPDGDRVPIQLTINERERLNRLRAVTDDALMIKASRTDPSQQEQEAVSQRLEERIKSKLHLTAIRLGVDKLGLDGRTLLGLYLRKLADEINFLKDLHGEDISKPADGLSSRPRLPSFPRWTATYYLKFQAGYLSPAAIEALYNKHETHTLSQYVEDELEKLTRWPTAEELRLKRRV